MKKTAVASVASPVEEAEERLCLCGCGLPVSPKREFRPGHDQRLRGVWLRSHDAGNREATEALLKRGWATEDSLAERAAKAAKKATKTKGLDADAEVKESTKEDVG